jgi:hypothetical protein
VSSTIIWSLASSIFQPTPADLISARIRTSCADDCPSVVHLVGNYIQQGGHRHDDDDEEDYDSEDFDDYDDLSLDEDDEVDEAPKG